MSTIGASELIITPAGRVYHIDLLPEELAQTVITVGDPARVAEVAKYFDSIDSQASHREFVSQTGRIGSKRITVLSSGIGPDNIDITLNEIDACVNVDFKTRTIKANHTQLDIIRLGTSGSLQSDIPVDSLVASSHGIGLDNLLHYYQIEYSEEEKSMAASFLQHSQLINSPIKPYAIEGSNELLKHFNDDYHQGITVTCPGFYAPQGRVVRADLQFPNLVDSLSSFEYNGSRVTNFEMETSAIFGLGKVFGHRCLSINTIIANRQDKSFSKDARAAVKNMISKSLEIIEKI
jgi:uridine phosphorylase